MTRPTIRAFDAGDLDEAARLLAARHRAQRSAVPELSASYEDPLVAREAIAELLAKGRASGAVAVSAGALVGYLVGAPRGSAWGPNMFVEGAGHAVAEAETVRDLYGVAAAGWFEAGATRHSVIVPATDPALVDAWFRVGFGQQHVHAIRPAAAPGDVLRPPAGVRIRTAERHDIPSLARLDLELVEHQERSPVFSGRGGPDLDEAVAEIEADFDDPAFTTYVAERDGAVIGSAIACDVGKSSEHRGIVEPPGAGFLGFAAVLPDARGRGAGRALGEAVLLWARDDGRATVLTDWRETNLLSSRAWPNLGFRPIFRRLHRAVA